MEDIMAPGTARIAVTLPSELRSAVDQAVREGGAKSRNELMANALRRELAALERAAIDAAFAEMAHDLDYQEESRRLTAEFESSDWEAFQLGENRR
jgi:metal-responsive CopG/Arc/MetJ family transcriptional regulator